MGVYKAVVWINCIFCPLLVALFIISIIILQGEIHTQSASLNTQHNQILALHKLVKQQANQTVTILNTTVVEVQESMAQEVATVDQTTSKNILVQGAATFTVLCILIFLWHMVSHLRQMYQPIIQRKVLAVLWMTPIYATSALLMLVLDNPVAAEWINVVKDFYEAYCIYMFLALLIAILGKGDRETVVNLLTNRAEQLKPPVHFFGFSPFLNRRKYEGNPHGLADVVLYQCQFCAMIYVFSRPITSIGMALSNTFLGSEWTYKSPQFVFVIIQNISIFLALSGLVAFYHAAHQDLAWCNPFPKFLCIKGVVFFSFWQGMTIHIIAKFVYQVENPVDWARRVQNFVICLEMLFFAVAHVFVFPPEEWAPDYRPKQRAKGRVGDNIGIHDFVKDVKALVKTRKHHKVRRRKGGPYGDLDMDVASAADLTSPTAAASSAFTIDENEEMFQDEELDEDNSIVDDDDEGDYIVIYRSKGKTRIVQGNGTDGSEIVEVPRGSSELDRIQGFVRSLTSSPVGNETETAGMSNGDQKPPATNGPNEATLPKVNDGELI